MLRLEPYEEIEPGIQRMLIERIDDSLAYLGDPAGDLDIAVHETRKNFKKMRAILRLVRDALPKKVYRAENACYRDAGRQLAPLRDSAVLVITLDTLRQEDPPSIYEATWDRVRQNLVARQAAIRRELLEESNAVAEVQEILRAARGRIPDLTLKKSGAAAFVPGLRRVYRRGRRRMAKAYAAEMDPHQFHDWRKRVKYLWYHIVILETIRPEILTSLAEDLHLLSEILGESHDLEVLRELLATHPEEFAAGADYPVLLATLRNKRQAMEQQARPLGTRIYATRPKKFARRIGKYWQESYQSSLKGT
jgi:CHAD domain-containing protein